MVTKINIQFLHPYPLWNKQRNLLLWQMSGPVKLINFFTENKKNTLTFRTRQRFIKSLYLAHASDTGKL